MYIHPADGIKLVPGMVFQHGSSPDGIKYVIVQTNEARALCIPLWYDPTGWCPLVSDDPIRIVEPVEYGTIPAWLLKNIKFELEYETVG